MKCKHTSIIMYRRRGDAWEPTLMLSGVTRGSDYFGCDRAHCRDCGHQMPLGPSADEDANVVIEARAAELAEMWQPEGGVRGQLTDDEGRGWNGWPHRQPLNDGEHCGFLAAQILHHERDLGPVNWAGHHLADYAINQDGSLPDAATHPDTGGRDE